MGTASAADSKIKKNIDKKDRRNSVKAKSSMEIFDEVSPTRKGVNDKDFCDRIQEEIPYAELLYEIS